MTKAYRFTRIRTYVHTVVRLSTKYMYYRNTSCGLQAEHNEPTAKKVHVLVHTEHLIYHITHITITRRNTQLPPETENEKIVKQIFYMCTSCQRKRQRKPVRKPAPQKHYSIYLLNYIQYFWYTAVPFHSIPNSTQLNSTQHNTAHYIII